MEYRILHQVAIDKKPQTWMSSKECLHLLIEVYKGRAINVYCICHDCN